MHLHADAEKNRRFPKDKKREIENMFKSKCNTRLLIFNTKRNNDCHEQVGWGMKHIQQEPHPTAPPQPRQDRRASPLRQADWYATFQSCTDLMDGHIQRISLTQTNNAECFTNNRRKIECTCRGHFWKTTWRKWDWFCSGMCWSYKLNTFASIG